MYQYVVQHTLQGIPGVRNISDDIIVSGPDQESHDKNLDLTLARLQSKGLTLNREKCVFSVPKLVFFGFTISADGIAPDDKKVDAVRNARTPQTAAEVRRFLGLVNYCARFIPNFATLALRELTRNDSEWKWGTPQQVAFDRLRAILTSDCVVAHYDQSADTELKVDASPVGLGAILLQRTTGAVRPVAYANRTLTDVERRYSQRERGSGGCVGLRAFSYLLVRQTFTPTTSRWRSFTIQSQSHHLGLKGGRFACSQTSLLLFTWRGRQTQPMYFQDCRWTTSRSGKGTLQKSISIMSQVMLFRKHSPLSRLRLLLRRTRYCNKCTAF